MAEPLQVYLCYATPVREYVRTMKVESGTTIGQAIEQSGVLQEFPEINLSTAAVGVYAKKKTLDTVLRERDRVEIYRPLVADPKDSRRRRAAKKDAAPKA
ncbi:RnfH family protein [Massilia agilis]|uniref:UPF0125 protein NX774_01090 n=1 Tax=Massilia agilis TaxID=1811226 RepID=A0ABT2D5E3_9BURK|nr:RnfH family protein [Massilia agilis]MCS0806518.1 RnfH family protein [Massilia agilis]